MLFGYAGKLLRVDLDTERWSVEPIDEATARTYLGGTGIGTKYLYDEVPPSVRWNDPENRLFFGSGPLGGTSVGGSGNFSVVTKGALTGGATSSQASGFFGAFLRFSGLDGIIVQGAAKKPVYLYVHDGGAELRNASNLIGKDTWQTEDLLKAELGKKELDASVFSIGPAGEHLVKFACIVGDRGHVVAHNGVGAVMGSKKLKAVVVERGKQRVSLAHPEVLSRLAGEMFEKVSKGAGAWVYNWGSLGDNARAKNRLAIGMLPCKNYTTNFFPSAEKLSAEHIRPLFQVKPHPCWACRFHHCHILQLTDGPHAGFIGEEPEYEGAAAFGPLIGVTEPLQAVLLSNLADRLGMDANECGWLVSWLMECFEKGILGAEQLNGRELNWGDTRKVEHLLQDIATRRGAGDLLAEGVRYAANQMGRPAKDLAIYTEKGNSPRTHDHRINWAMMLDTCVSDTGTDEDGAMGIKPVDVGLSASADSCTASVAAAVVAGIRGKTPVDDCLGVCKWNTTGVPIDYKARLVAASTGWDFTPTEAMAIGNKIVNLLRTFNIRHGLTAELDRPSSRYSSTPIDGPCEGIGVGNNWDEIRRDLYERLGWEKATGKPLPETLGRAGLDRLVPDIW